MISPAQILEYTYRIVWNFGYKRNPIGVIYQPDGRNGLTDVSGPQKSVLDTHYLWMVRSYPTINYQYG